MKVKKVYKYATGETVPNDAVYLCTEVETKSFVVNEVAQYLGALTDVTRVYNEFVWHYFLVEVEETT